MRDMPVLAIKCPNCSGNISLDDDREFGFCQYCGTRIKIEDFVVNNITYNDYNASQIRRLKAVARAHLDNGDYFEADEIIKELDSMDSKDPELYLLMMESLYRKRYFEHDLLEHNEEFYALITPMFGQYRKYSANKKSLTDVIKSFALPPYDLKSEFDYLSKREKDRIESERKEAELKSSS